MLKLACQEQLLPGDDLVAKFDFARRAGFDGIELRAKGNDHFKGRLPELRAAVRAGVVMKTVCPETDHFIGDFDADQRRDAIAQIRTQLSVIAEIGGEGMLTPASWGMFSLRLPPFAPPRTAGGRPEGAARGADPARRARGAGGRLARPGGAEPVRGLHDQPAGPGRRPGPGGRGGDRYRGPSGPAPTSSTSTSRRTTWRRPSSRPGPRSFTSTSTTRTGSSPAPATSTSPTPSAALRAIDYDGWHTLECRLRGEPETALPATAAFLRQFA